MSLDFDNYFAVGYADADYTVRAEDSVYVESDYVDTGYFATIRSAISDLNTSFTISADGDFATSSASISIAASLSVSALDQDRASASISMVLSQTSAANITRSSSASLQIGGDRAWDAMNTWDAPAQDTWRRRVDVVAQRRVNGSASLGIVCSTSVDAVRTRRGSSTTSIAVSTSTVATRTRLGSSSLNTNTNVSAGGVVGFGGSSTLDISTSISGAGILRVDGRADLSLATTTISAAGRLRGAIALDGGEFSVSATPNRTRTGSSSASTNLSISTSAQRKRPGAITLNINTSVSADMIRQRLGANLSLGVFSSEVNGGKLLGIADEVLALSVSVSSNGRKVTVDPFTTIRVEGETRTGVVAPESRIITPKTETRINTINQETRRLRVYQETRILDAVE